MSDIKYKVQRQHMIESTETNSFIDKIYKLVAENLSNTKGMDVIMLLGGTGNGKSTILNMIAANEITCSRAKGKWIFNSNPSVAMIGHGVSTTFQPNYWEGNGLRIYDCPGFNDTRSLQYEISKSFFIKEIADNAKSFKIILVGDIHSVHGGRCGPFMEYINQLKGFIHNFNESKDYSIVITKAQSDLIPQDITDEFKQCLKVEISPAKATLIYQPEKAGIYDYSKINFKAIFQAAPSISSKCNLPLSAEAKLKLAQISKQLNNSIIKAVKAFVFAARIHYLQAIASKIETDKTSFKKIFDIFQQIDIFKGSSNPEDFIKKLQQYCLKLDKLCQVRFEFSYLLKFISKKINQIQFLKKKIESFEICANNWVQCIQFSCQQFNRSNSAETMQDINSFSLFLRASANIDVDKSIEQQAHQYLVTQQIIPTKYSGSKQVTFYLQKNDKCDKTLDKSCVIKEVFQKNIQYQGSVYFQDSKRVTGKVSVESCSCGNFLVNRCLACSHFTKYLDYSLSVSCSGYENYKGRSLSSVAGIY